MISPLCRRTSVFACGVLVLASMGLVAIDACPAAAQDTTTSDRAALRSRVEARYEVVRLSRGVGLRPKDSARKIGMIEIADGAIAIDGTPASGSVVRERLGADADLIFALSYLDPQDLRTLFGPAEPAPERPPVEPAPPVAAPEPPRAPAPPGPPSRTRRSVGERVRIFGSVNVPADEEVRGEVVAVMGSVRVDGHVSGEVVAVMGSVELGPEARVGGDVVAVGGRVHRADGAEVRGNITEVAFAPDMVGFKNAPWWMAPDRWQPFRGVARLMGTVFRLFVLGLLVSIVVLVARRPVEQIGRRVAAQPLKMAAVGLLVQLLLFPVLFLTSVILAISIIGIPLLLLIPVALVAVLVVLLAGFTGAVHTVGGLAATRASWSADQPYLRVYLGVLVVLAPLLVARLVGLAGGPFNLVALMVASVALGIEYVVWTTGFGAALTAAYEGWQTKGSPAAIVPPPLPPAAASGE